MHEFSAVRSLITQALAAAAPAPPAAIRQITVAIGPLTGMEPLLVQHAFDGLKSEVGLEQCLLVIDAVRLQARCRTCQECFTVEDFFFQCPRCHSPRVQVTEGDQFLLLRIRVEETPTPPMED